MAHDDRARDGQTTLRPLTSRTRKSTTAMTSRTQMKLPSVYPLTIPSSHRMIRMIAIVSSTSQPSPIGLQDSAPGPSMDRSGCNLSAGRRRQLSRMVIWAVVLIAGVAVPRPAEAQKDLAKFLAGAAVGLAAHETGHLIVDAVVGADVDLKRVSAGPIPFFAITHQPVTPA